MFHFQNTISYADLFNFFLLLVAITAVVFTYRQIKGNDNTQKAIFFKELYLMMLRDPDVANGFRLVDEERFTYDNDHFKDSWELEHTIDSMLVAFDLMCYLYTLGVVSEYEMNIWTYKLMRIYQSPDIQRYITFLEVHFLTIGVHSNPYLNFRSYCEKEQSKLRYDKYLTIDQAYWYYKEQKSKLDALLASAEQHQPPKKDDETYFERKLQALDMLIDRFQHPDNFNQEDVLYKAINESAIYDRLRVILGLEALKAKLQFEENKRLQKEVHSIPEKISMQYLFEEEHLFRNVRY